jgi:hypothetical protein
MRSKDLFDIDYDHKRECSSPMWMATLEKDKTDFAVATPPAWQALAGMRGISPELSAAFRACATTGCDQLAAIPEALRQEALDALARAGNQSELYRQSQQAERAGDLVSPLAWLLYRRWLMLAGCGTLPEGIGDIAALTRQIEQLSARMTGAQRAAGIARFQALVVNDGALARQLGCLP